jgi:hypothetical protein
MGRNNDPHLRKLLQAIKEGVASDKIVCPLSQDIFIEVFSQKDPATLTETVSLVDELSKGVCLMEYGQRLNVEFSHFLYANTLGQESLFPLDSLIWTKTGYVLGYVSSNSNKLPRDVVDTIQKSMIDLMWEIKLSDIQTQIGVTPEWRKDPNFISEMNEGKFKHVNDHKSFKQLFLVELHGILETMISALDNVMAHYCFKKVGRHPTAQERQAKKAGNHFAGLIYSAFKYNKIKNDLPTLFVSTSLHAALRWDKKRKYEFNDMADIRHAAMALPYCDMLLTEKSLCTLVHEKHLGFAPKFPCRTFSEPTHAISHLIGLLQVS